MARVFFSYSHKDEALRDQLEVHLTLLKRQGLIEAWHDRRILAGSELDKSIASEMEASNIILLLISPDFIASDYCYSREMTRALERHHTGEARVIPVILRHCDWHSAPFGKLLAVPKDGRPVVAWPNHDEAFTDVAVHIRSVVENYYRANLKPTVPALTASQPAQPTGPAKPVLPRSSNLRLRKEFTDHDRDEFLREAFEYMARFFEGTLQALEERNPGIKGKFERVDTRHFLAAVYRQGKVVARCSIALGNFMGERSESITFSYDQAGGGINEWLTVESGSQSLFLKPTGMQGFTDTRRKVGGLDLLGAEDVPGLSDGRGHQHLSPQGAAELFWSLLIRRLQE